MIYELGVLKDFLLGSLPESFDGFEPHSDESTKLLSGSSRHQTLHLPEKPQKK